MPTFSRYLRSLRPQNLYTFISLIFLTTFLAACSSSPNPIKSEIIANSDKTLETPKWVLSPQVILERDSNVVFIYKMYLDGSARPDACVSMAKTQAVGEMVKYIKNAVTSSGQVEDLNDSSDPSFSALTAYLSQGNISGAQVTTTYWEQSIEGDESGYRPIKRLMCAVQVAIGKANLQKQMREAMDGAPGGNPEIRKKLIQAQKEFLDSVGKSDADGAHKNISESSSDDVKQSPQPR